MKVSRKDFICCSFFIIFWLLPIIYTGLTYRDTPFLPRTLTYLQRISHLFTRISPVWETIYIQALPEGEKGWVVLPMEDYFRLKPFGYRTRLYEMLLYSKDFKDFKKGEEAYKARQKELAHWVAGRYAKRYPQRPPLLTVRFVAGIYTIEKDRTFEGRWKDVAIDHFEPKDQYIFSTHYLKNEF